MNHRCTRASSRPIASLRCTGPRARSIAPALRAIAAALLAAALLMVAPTAAQQPPATAYHNHLVPLEQPSPLLADYPQYVEPLVETVRFEAPPLVVDKEGDLEVRAWRFSYNARGIVEVPNRIEARHTALVVVHPWGVDDGQGWRQPEPAGVALFCTPEKNAIYQRHVAEVLAPLVERLRPHVGVVAYSLPGQADPIRRRLYRSVHGRPTADQRRSAAEELSAVLERFEYRGGPLEAQLALDGQPTTAAYFRAFRGLDSGDHFNGAGFWSLPIPVVASLAVDEADVVIFDAEGYEPLASLLRSEQIRHVLLAGYATDMCLCSTTAGYENLSPDFNLFIVGDATLATFPACDTPRFATQTALAKASLSHLITQVSWIRPVSGDAASTRSSP